MESSFLQNTASQGLQWNHSSSHSGQGNMSVQIRVQTFSVRDQHRSTLPPRPWVRLSELISTHQAQFLWWYLACKVLFPEACRFLPWWDSSFSWDSGGELEGLICRWSLWVYLSLGENRLDILRIKFCLSCVISATEVGWESNILSSGHPG